MASVSDEPVLPSIVPGEKPAASSSTCAWKISPLIGDPGVPGATQAFRHGFPPLFAEAAGRRPRPRQPRWRWKQERYATQLSGGIDGSALQRCRRSTVSQIHVGCSGWVYKHWRGLFYPEGLPQKRWFERYAEEFDTVEINASFYRLPLETDTSTAGARRRRDGFRYAVKVNRFITHLKKLRRRRRRGGPLHRAGPEARGQARAAALPAAAEPAQRRADGSRPSSRASAAISSMSSSSGTRAGTTRKSSQLLDRYGVGYVAHDLRGLDVASLGERPHRLCPLPRRRRQYCGRYSDEASARMDRLVPRAVARRAAASGAISTTTSTATPSTMRRR